ncbi:MAG: hypothetical protein KJ645_10680 [Planctomycetes bacterium]|nr:hypothetical protein [Planctomycetota bacterium]
MSGDLNDGETPLLVINIEIGEVSFDSIYIGTLGLFVRYVLVDDNLGE